MIKEIKCYTLICDNCGADLNKDSECSCWTDKVVNYDIARDSGWIEEGGEWYCGDCWSYDENEVIKLRKFTY